jgi:lysophospholipase L1-like esterase
MGRNTKAVVVLAGALLTCAPVTAGAQALEPPSPVSKYVAMGSSFASGPGITVSADTPSTRCARSRDNYAHQLARRHGLALTDVSCSGAVTANLLTAWNELPAQLDAVDAQTRLVTVTVGGNDVKYSAGLAAEGCTTAARQGVACGGLPPPPTEQDYADLEARLRRIADEVRRRAPAARLVFVDYPTILPSSGTCPALSLTRAQADASREINRRVVAATARAAQASGSGLVTASAISADHNACSAVPWANGYPVPSSPTDGVAFHPRLAAHTAAADALDRLIWPSPVSTGAGQ